MKLKLRSPITTYKQGNDFILPSTKKLVSNFPIGRYVETCRKKKDVECWIEFCSDFGPALSLPKRDSRSGFPVKWSFDHIPIKVKIKSKQQPTPTLFNFAKVTCITSAGLPK
jgi:hypothetical protein